MPNTPPMMPLTSGGKSRGCSINDRPIAIDRGPSTIGREPVPPCDIDYDIDIDGRFRRGFGASGKGPRKMTLVTYLFFCVAVFAILELVFL